MFPSPIVIRFANRWAGCFLPGNAPQSAPISHCLQINGKLNSTDASRPKRPAGNSGWQSVPPAVRMTVQVIRKPDPMPVLALVADLAPAEKAATPAKHNVVPDPSRDQQIKLDDEGDPVLKTAETSG